MIRTTSTLIISLILFFSFTSRVFAVTVTINNSPLTVSSEPFEVSASVSGATDGTNFLRIDLYKDGTTNYFGETYNGSSWISGSDGTQYFPVQIQDASGSATFQGRLGSPSAGDYPGPGSYKLKVRRYTTSGSSYTFSDPGSIQITFFTPSPTPDPTQAPTTAPTTAPTVAPTATSTKTPTPVPTKTPTPKPTKTSTSTPEPEVLGVETNLVTDDPTPTSTSEPLPKKKIPFTPIILILSGLVMVGFAVLQLIRASKNPQSS